MNALRRTQELVIGDLDDPASLANALKGIRRAFLLTNSTEQAEVLQTNFVTAAQAAGVKHIVKLSQLAASPDSPVRYLRYHAAVESRIRQSGLAYTFLRPNLFMQGLLVFHDSILHQGKFFAPAGEARVSAIDIRDIAAAAAAALTREGHEGKTYDLTGPEALTHAQMAACLSESLGHTVQFVDVTPADMRQAVLTVGFPEWQADGLIEDYAHYSRDEASLLSPAIQEVTGRAPYYFRKFANDYKGSFS